MDRRTRRTLCAIGAVAITLVAWNLVVARAGIARADVGNASRTAAIPVGGKVQADNACYVRLPDLPEPRYAGFGAYNADSGVLVYAGGAEKRTDRLTLACYDMWAIKLDGSMQSWAPIPYSATAGYLRQPNRGCREMGVVPLSASSWASVGGKSGCDGTTALLGDIKEIHVGESATPSEVRFVANTGADLASLPDVLKANGFRLSKPFAVYDSTRDRIVFGQGTFNEEREEPTRAEVYEAVRHGSVWRVRELHPQGARPARRFGSCAAYVADPTQGLDGVIVLGGQEAGPPNTTVALYNEVWWLDLSVAPGGRWVNITDRFDNLAAFGARREAACAYDPTARKFYTWMGRADATIPDGASHSAGIWRVGLDTLGDATTRLTWERLAKDLQADVTGMRLVPSVFDLKNGRFFAVGGRQGLGEYTDVWAIYPDIVGDACTNLDPYAPYRNPVTPTSVPRPTLTPLPPNPEVCPETAGRVPPAVLSAALASAGSVPGHNQRCNPNAPASTINHVRDRLSLEFIGRPYHPIYNSLTWKCGCP